MVDYTLVGVDAQSNFGLSEAVLAAMAREVKLARSREQAVVFLELPGWGWNDFYPPTYKQLTDLVRGYKKTCREYKSIADGSVMVLEACRKYGFCANKFRVCGAFADACVLKTVEGLLLGAPEALIEVVEDACYPSLVRTNNWKQLYPADSRITFVCGTEAGAEVEVEAA